MLGKSDFIIKEIKVKQMCHPLGLDEKQPVFSWVLESSGRNMLQEKAQILVGTRGNLRDMWDSGVMDTDCSVGIPYQGASLAPETRYEVTVRVWDTTGEMQEAKTYFETGLMYGENSWEGARWIGAPEYYVAGDTVSVFVLEGSFGITKGSRAGIVFGSNDRRLLDRTKNEAMLEGENYIRYVLNVEKFPAMLEIYRVGYAASDCREKPFYTAPVREVGTGRELLTEDNIRLPHKMTIEVRGNAAYVYLDDCLIDEAINQTSRGPVKGPRILNPLGGTDVTTFPRLCSVGYYAGEKTSAVFQGLSVKNLRKPCAEIFSLDGDSLEGECQKVQEASRHSIPMLRRNFKVRGKVAYARLYATARGIYECSINGKQIGNEYFAPGASQYDRHLMYQTYDVTDILTQGENGIGCVLASGWWSDSFSFRLDKYNYWGDRMSFLAKLAITYENGERDVFVTNDTDWDYYGEGPYRFAGFFNGEQFDGRKAWIYREFSTPDFKLQGMKKPQIITPILQEEEEAMFPGAACWPARNDREPVLTGNYQAPVREAERFTARAMTEPIPGVYIYDLGQEIAGVPILKFREKEGQRITIRYGEMLYPDLERYGKLRGQMLQANLREASNTDIYICGGDGEEIYQPRFTFHGYRYIEITGVTKPPALSDVQSILLSSVEKVTGKFACDNPLVNRFAENVKYSQYCNFISIPTDCPQRNERMGWLGDTHIFCRTATYQADVKNFYLRNLQAMRDLQKEDGRLPSIAPFGGGFGGMTYESAMILIVWELYQQYGDVSVIQEYYPAMKKWMEAIHREGMPGIPSLPLPIAWLGDWLATEPADNNLMYNAFHYRNEVLMEKFASILGNQEDARSYALEAKKTRDYWNSVFVDKDTGMTKNTDGTLCDVQGSYSFGLFCDVFEEQYKEKAYAHLARKTREANYTIRTGFFGTGPINSMLSEGGYEELAGKTMTQTAYPSWLYPVTQGATTIWERWNSYTKEDGFGENNSMNSFNHYSLGSVLGWLYENILGIHRDEQKPGFKHFFLKPEVGTFGFARGGIDTPHGRIESAWEKNNGEIKYRCTIPANTTAELELAGEKRHLGSGCYEVLVTEDGCSMIK